LGSYKPISSEIVKDWKMGIYSNDPEKERMNGYGIFYKSKYVRW
jgi:hypothetical protein